MRLSVLLISCQTIFIASASSFEYPKLESRQIESELGFSSSHTLVRRTGRKKSSNIDQNLSSTSSSIGQDQPVTSSTQRRPQVVKFERPRPPANVGFAELRRLRVGDTPSSSAASIARPRPRPPIQLRANADKSVQPQESPGQQQSSTSAPAQTLKAEKAVDSPGRSTNPFSLLSGLDDVDASQSSSPTQRKDTAVGQQGTPKASQQPSKSDIDQSTRQSRGSRSKLRKQKADHGASTSRPVNRLISHEPPNSRSEDKGKGFQAQRDTVPAQRTQKSTEPAPTLASAQYRPEISGYIPRVRIDGHIVSWNRAVGDKSAKVEAYHSVRDPRPDQRSTSPARVMGILKAPSSFQVTTSEGTGPEVHVLTDNQTLDYEDSRFVRVKATSKQLSRGNSPWKGKVGLDARGRGMATVSAQTQQGGSGRIDRSRPLPSTNVHLSEDKKHTEMAVAGTDSYAAVDGEVHGPGIIEAFAHNPPRE